jgi:hypothetical protein
MTTSNRAAARASLLRRNILGLYWGAWSELGVSGWGRTHDDWAIDPEPLITFTTEVAAHDARLRDEVTDWCIQNWRQISQVRLRHILRENALESSKEWGEFAATVNRSAGSKFPGATIPRLYEVTGRSNLRSLSEPSVVYLRIRAIFGLGARTEVLRYLLFNDERSTAAMIASKINYAKRNVADSCEILVQAGLLHSTSVGNRLYFSLDDPPTLLNFIGNVPSETPDWPALLRVVNKILEWTDSAERMPAKVLMVETHQIAAAIEDDLALLQIAPAVRQTGDDFINVWLKWAMTATEDLSVGRWPASQELVRARRRENVSKIRSRRAT